MDEGGAPSPGAAAPPWRVLIVDDDAEVHAMTRLVMRKFTFQGRPLELLSAYSGQAALELLRDQPDIALILLDVVMETEDAGLRLVARIREELGNHAVRIVLRTGQPGQMPEHDIIHSYDINDYKAKTELTAQKLATSVVAALRSYAQISDIDRLRDGVARVAVLGRDLDPSLGVETLVATVLTRLAELLRLPATGFLAAVPEAATPGQPARIRATLGPVPWAVGQDLPPALSDGLMRGASAVPPAAVPPTAIPPAAIPVDGWLLIALPPLPINTALGDPVGLPACLLGVALPHPLDASGQRLAWVAANRLVDVWETLAAMERLRATRRATALLLAAGRPQPDGAGTWRQPDGGRGARLSRLAVGLAQRLRHDPSYAPALGGDALEYIAMGAMLYDVGMMGVPGDLPAKPGSLTQDERDMVRRHAAQGAGLMRAAAAQVGGDAYMDFCAMLAQTHHERWDGAGYPDGLAGDAIPLAARLIAVADTYDALTHPRIPRPALTHEAACRELAAAAGSQLDPALVAAFLLGDAPV